MQGIKVLTQASSLDAVPVSSVVLSKYTCYKILNLHVTQTTSANVKMLLTNSW